MGQRVVWERCSPQAAAAGATVTSQPHTTVLLASALAVIGYIAFPTAPPRLAHLGIVDIVSGHTRVELNTGLVSALYNPYAAVPAGGALVSAIAAGATALLFRQFAAEPIALPTRRSAKAEDRLAP